MTNTSGKVGNERLTQQEHSCLCAVPDWKAPFEVIAALYPTGTTLRQRNHIEKTLKKLRDKYLVRYSAANNTYRITDKGRVALSTPTGDAKP